MKKILITGARSGIAKAVIDKIKDKEYIIYATTHTELEAIRLKEIYNNYKNIDCFKLDITDSNDQKKINNLNIDILVCNAAISNGGSLLEMDIEQIRDNFETNVFSNLKIIQIYLNKVIDSNGKVIIMSSLAGIIPINFIGSYASTKASLIKIAEILKNELKLINKDIKICLIEPGIYLTGFNRYMFMNKYNNKSLYFKNKINTINKRENLILNILGHKGLNSIANKIVKAIISNKPRFIYRAPLLQVIGVKIYSLFRQ